MSAKPRRPKPVNYGKRRTLRLGEREEASVAHMRAALAKNRGVEPEDVDYSEALRLLLVENEKAAMALAGRPEAWPASTSIQLPDEMWEILTDCRNRLSHSQGSLYTIMRKLNFDESVSTDEVRDAFNAVQEQKAILARLEETLVSYVTTASAGAGAKAGTEAG